MQRKLIIEEFRLPGPLLIENILLKLITNAQQCLSSPNQCLALQLVEVKFVKPNLHKTPCACCTTKILTQC